MLIALCRRLVSKAARKGRNERSPKRLHGSPILAVCVMSALVAPACLLDGGPLTGAGGAGGGAGSGGGSAAGGAAGGEPTGGAGGAPAICGNGKVEAPEQCDGSTPDGVTCEGLGYPPGEMACGSTCTWDASGCDQGEPWWDPAWGYRIHIVVDGTFSPIYWESFATLVTVNDKALSNAQLDGDDLVVVPVGGSAKMAHEIDYFDAQLGSLALWVNIPMLTPGQKYEYYLYFGNPASGSQASAQVWPASYSAVYHLGENAVNGQTAAVHKNALGNGIDGAQRGNEAKPGKIGRAQSFDGADWVDIPLGGPITLSDTSCAVSAWIWTTSPAEQSLFSKTNNGSHDWSDILIGTGHDGPYFGMDSYNVNFVRGTTNVVTGSWHYVVWSQLQNGGAGFTDVWTVYVDGVLEGMLEATTFADNSFYLLRLGAGTPGSYFSNNWTGLIDEVRISTVGRDINWVLATYNNQNDSSQYVTLGPAQKRPPP